MARLANITLFLGDTSASVGVSLEDASLDAVLLRSGDVALRAAGVLTVTGASSLVFIGTVAAEYNPTSAARTLGGTIVAAQTVRLAGTGIALGLPGDVTLRGNLTVVRTGTGDDTEITVDAAD